MSESQAAAMADPFQVWRDWLSTSERQWNDFFNQMMSTDEFGQGMGQMMDSYLTTQRNFSEAFGRYFTALNLPSRTDVLTLGNRLIEIEERLTAIEALLRGLSVAPAAAAAEQAAAETVRPPRTKKPAAS